MYYDGPMGKTRADPIEYQARTLKVAEWVVDGLPWTEMVERGGEVWGLSNSSMARYIKAAREMISTQIDRGGEALQTWFIGQHLDLYNLARNGDPEKGIGIDLRLALEVLKDFQRLTGAYAPERAEVSNITAYAEMSLEERASTLKSVLGSLAEKAITVDVPSDPSDPN